MEQINLSINKNLAGFQTKASKADPSVNVGDTFFDALLEQTNEQYINEAAPEQPKQSQPADQNAENEAVQETEKPVTEKGEEEEETCDVAREAAAAQIVWIVDPVVDQQEIEQQDAVILDPVVNGIASEETMAEAADMSLLETEGQTAEADELVVIDQMVNETVQENVQVETEVNEQADSELSMDVEVNTAETDETGGEAVVAETPLFEGVETAPIKVAEAPKGAEETGNVERQVVQKVSDLLENGETKVQIQLEPVELGKLTIELTRSADGTLSILLDAENLQTRSLLEKHMGTLQEMLIDRGQKVAQVTVDNSEEAQRQDNQQRDDFFNDRNGQQKEQREQQRRDDPRDGTDFLQQLRLGLIPLGEEK